MAFLFGLGVLLVWSAVVVPRRIRQVGLAGDLEAIQGREGTGPQGEAPLLARAFGPLIRGWGEQLMRALNRTQRDRQKLMVAAWPKPWHTLEDFYASKVLAAALLACAGLAGGLVAGAQASVLLAPLLGGLGFFLPDLSLDQQAKRRRAAIVAEMASVPDRIAIQVQSGKALPLAIRDVAARPGGPLVQELRRVAADYAVDGDLTGALEGMAARTGVPELRDFVGRVRLALEQGTAIAPLLQGMGGSARESLNLMLEEQALRNSFLMILPIGGLVLPAVLVMLGAPGLSLFFGGGPGF